MMIPGIGAPAFLIGVISAIVLALLLIHLEREDEMRERMTEIAANRYCELAKKVNLDLARYIVRQDLVGWLEEEGYFYPDSTVDSIVERAITRANKKLAFKKVL